MTATQQKFISDFLFLIEISVLILVFHLWVPGGGVEAVLILGDQIVRCKVNSDPFRNISRA